MYGEGNRVLARATMLVAMAVNRHAYDHVFDQGNTQ